MTFGGDRENKAFADAGPPVHDCPVEAGGGKGGRRTSRVQSNSAEAWCVLYVRAREVIPSENEQGRDITRMAVQAKICFARREIKLFHIT